MKHIIELASFEVKNDVTEEKFLKHAKDFSENFLALQKGLISHKLLKEGNIWSDMAEWLDMQSAQAIEKSMMQSDVARAYLSCINSQSVSVRHMSVV